MNMNHVFTLSIQGSICLSVLIVILSAAVFAVIAYLSFYFFAYKLFKKGSDWGKRAIFLVVISLIGLGIRLLCVLSSQEVTSFESALSYALQTLYATFGVFGFEGQENIGPYEILFFYTTVWVAVSYVVVVFTGLDYSLQSTISLWRPHLGDTKIFIFTKATDESYALAESIAEEYAHKHHIIIFASDENDTFDRKNELHKKIRSSGFLYLTVEKKGTDKEKKSLVDYLHISYRHIHNVKVFAMERDESDRGNETRNTDIIFDDVECLVHRLNKKKYNKYLENCDKHYIRYYIYVNNEINNEFFEQMLKSKVPQGISAEEYNKYKTFFRIKGFSEAELCGHALQTERQKLEIKRIKEYKTFNHFKDDIHRSIVVGFGPNGQASLKNLYIDSTGAAKDNKSPTRFESHIFDINIDSFSAIYEMIHPSIIFNHASKLFEVDEEAKDINLEKIKEAYSDPKFKDVVKEMNFPVYTFYNQDIKGNGILKEVSKKCLEGEINSIIISMGRDELNIELVNSLLKELRQHLYSSESFTKGSWQLDIFVNLRQEHAENRLFWSNSLEENIHPGINVIPYGGYKEMFTFENIISDAAWIKSNKTYQSIDNASKDNECLQDYHKFGEREKEAIKLLQDLSKVNEGEHYVSSSYERDSSLYAHLFYAYYRAYFDAHEGEDLQKIYDYLSNIEHLRWNRYIIANGFMYSANFKSKVDAEKIAKEQLYSDETKARRLYNRDFVKLHGDLVPTHFLSEFAILYDYMNVLAARSELEIK